MYQAFLEKTSTTSAVLAALACPICFPKLALIGAAVGLGALSPFERYTAFVVQGLFVLAFIGQAIAYRQHGNKWLLAFAGVTTATLFAGYYIVRSSILLEIALVGLVAASAWQIIEARRCAACASEKTASVGATNAANLPGGTDGSVASRPLS